MSAYSKCNNKKLCSFLYTVEIYTKKMVIIVVYVCNDRMTNARLVI